MTKFAIKSEKVLPFGSIYPMVEIFDRQLGSTIDRVLKMSRQRRWKKSEINSMEFEPNSILIKKREEKIYRIVVQRRYLNDLWEEDYVYRCILTTIAVPPQRKSSRSITCGATRRLF